MIVCQLITGDMSMLDFAEISDMTSPHGQLLVNLVRHIVQKFPEEMPACYKSFMANICKPTSVRGLLQVLSPEPLEYLEEYCKEVLDVRSHYSQHQLKVLESSLPAIWPDLDEVCNIENSVFLPKPVSQIILRLLKVDD